MPAPKIPRKPIPKFTKAELNRANLCAEALWYGVNFKNGDLYPISASSLSSNLVFLSAILLNVTIVFSSYIFV